MEEFLHQLVWLISHNLQGFIHPRWRRNFSINGIIHYPYSHEEASIDGFLCPPPPPEKVERDLFSILSGNKPGNKFSPHSHRIHGMVYLPTFAWFFMVMYVKKNKHTHTIHAWYIYLHLYGSYGKNIKRSDRATTCYLNVAWNQVAGHSFCKRGTSGKCPGTPAPSWHPSLPGCLKHIARNHTITKWCNLLKSWKKKALP